MEDEEKIADGIYITKAKHKIENNFSNNNKESLRKNYHFKSTSELIALLENDFESIEKEIKMLFEANEEMLNFDPNDYDLIEARKENLEVINKRLLFLKDIQNELSLLCPINPLCKIDIFDYFLPKKVDKEENSNSDVISEIDL